MFPFFEIKEEHFLLSCSRRIFFCRCSQRAQSRGNVSHILHINKKAFLAESFAFFYLSLCCAACLHQAYTSQARYIRYSWHGKPFGEFLNVSRIRLMQRLGTTPCRKASPSQGSQHMLFIWHHDVRYDFELHMWTPQTLFSSLTFPCLYHLNLQVALFKSVGNSIAFATALFGSKNIIISTHPKLWHGWKQGIGALRMFGAHANGQQAILSQASICSESGCAIADTCEVPRLQNETVSCHIRTLIRFHSLGIA